MIAEAAARRGAERVRRALPPTADAWTLKGVQDFVTEVDRDSERGITDSLLSQTPGSRVLGEELSPERTRADLLWIVDPLDGTTNYLHGYRWYAVSIAAVVAGHLAAGVVLDIQHDLVYRAVAGEGAWCGERRLAVSDIADPRHALIGTGFPFRTPELLPRYLRNFTAICRGTAGVRRAGSAALDLADVASGRFEGFWELDLAPWDVAAGTLLIREAGGLVSDLEGGSDVVRHGGLIAGNPSLHRWLLEIIKEEG